MRALILAAGMGTRLEPITYRKPKCMVEVNGMPIIYKQIENLIENGIEDITVVAGYKADMVHNALGKDYPDVNLIINEDYQTTNNMYSAYLAKEYYIGKPFLLMNGDVFYDMSIITELLNDKYLNSMVIEEGTYNEESMKVIFDNTQIRKISKEISRKDAYGVSIDVYKFSAEGSREFFKKLCEYIEVNEEKTKWTEVALNDILSHVQFKPCPLKGRWVEIDDHDDLHKAECIFA